MYMRVKLVQGHKRPYGHSLMPSARFKLRHLTAKTPPFSYSLYTKEQVLPFRLSRLSKRAYLSMCFRAVLVNRIHFNH